MVRLPAGILNMVTRNWIPLMPFHVCICLFPHILPPPSHGDLDSILWQKTAFSSSILHSWGSRALAHRLPSPNKICYHRLVQLTLCHPGVWALLEKFLLLSPVHPNFFCVFWVFVVVVVLGFGFGLQQSTGISLLETWTLWWLSPLGYWLKSVLSRNFLSTAERGWSLVISSCYSPACTDVCLPIIWCTDGQDSSWVP